MTRKLRRALDRHRARARTNAQTTANLAGQSGFVHLTRPPFLVAEMERITGALHSGQWVGKWKTVLRAGAFFQERNDTAGMDDFARRFNNDRVAHTQSLRRNSSSLCKVARLIVLPAGEKRPAKLGNRRERPVRPT